ncbi:MAG: T9SS type A sorting domain-containing protein [Bacteroidota bacterium]
MKKLFLGTLLFAFCMLNARADNDKPDANAGFSTPVGFWENNGQIKDEKGRQRPDVLYVCNMGGMKIALMKDGFMYDVYEVSEHKSSAQNDPESGKVDIKGHAIKVSFLNASDAVSVIPEGKSSDFTIYSYLDNTEGIKAFRYNKVTYKNVYRGIDLVFTVNPKKGAKNPVKFDYVINQGADINDIKLKYEGAKAISVNKNNELVLSTIFGDLLETIPLSYNGSTSKTVDVNYNLDGNVVSLIAGKTDKNQKLVVDPVPERAWGTYYGGNGYDEITSVTEDIMNGSTDDVYVGGNTTTIEHFVISTFSDYTLTGSKLAFVACFSIDGDRQWGNVFGGSTLPGGNNATQCNKVVAYGGNLYLGGWIQVTSGSITASGFQTVYGSALGVTSRDGLVVMFKNSGTVDTWTYYGGTGSDIVNDMTISGTSLYICGVTTSNTPGSISTTGVFQQNKSGGQDGFVACLASNLTSRTWGSYFGGSNTDYINAISLGNTIPINIYIAGSSNSTGLGTTGAFQMNLAGSEDGIIARINSTGSALLNCSYFGGLGIDKIKDMDFASVNLEGRIYVAGLTYSSNFPATNGTTLQGTNDGFVGIFNSSLGSLSHCSYIGGSGNEDIFAIDATSRGRYLFSGFTSSTSGFEHDTWSPDPPSTYQGGLSDAFFALYEPDNTVSTCSYYGSNGDDMATDIRFSSKSSNYLYVVGNTTGDNDAFGSPGSFQPTFAYGGKDGFIAKFRHNTIDVSSICYEYFAEVLAGYSYQWAELISGTWVSIAGATNSSFSPDHGGIYHVTATGIGLPVLVSTNINVTVLPIIVPVTCQTITFPTNCLYTANPSGGTLPYSYLWTGGAITQSRYGSCTSGYTVTVTDALGCQEHGHTPACGLFKIAGEEDSPMKTAGINIYPNPTSGKFAIDFSFETTSSTSMIVFNMLGETIFEKTGELPKEIDLTGKPQGIYMIKVVDGENVYFKKLIKN